MPFLSSSRGEFQFWNTATLEEPHKLEGNFAGVISIALSPDEKLVAIGTGGGVAHVRLPHGDIRIGDPATGRLLQTLKGRDAEASLEPSPFLPTARR